MTTEHINSASDKASAAAIAKLPHVTSDPKKSSAPEKAIVSAPKPSEIDFDPAALAMPDQAMWTFNIPLPTKRPFRESRLRIDTTANGLTVDLQLVRLLADAVDVQDLVIASPHLSVNQLAKSVGRCRKQMMKLLSVSWLSPRIIEAITDGTQPRSINRTRLLEAALPADWVEQEALLGFTD